LLDNGQSLTYRIGQGAGNSNSIDNRLLSYNYTAQVVTSSGLVVNESGVNTHNSDRLDCNSCHTTTGINGAPGRITSVRAIPTENTNTNLSFTTDILPILTNKCQSCHGTNGSFTVTTATETYTNINNFNGIDVVTPENSSLLTKANGVNHGGGTILTNTSSEYITIRDWITQGAINN
jgi:cytochrome c